MGGGVERHPLEQSRLVRQPSSQSLLIQSGVMFNSSRNPSLWIAEYPNRVGNQLRKNLSLLAALALTAFVTYAFLQSATLDGLEQTRPEEPARRPFIRKWSPETNEPNSHRIFFHGLRGKSPLAVMKQSCAVESAARHNPERPIELFISEEDADGGGLPLDPSNDPWLAVLDKYPNVAVLVYNESEYFSGSPLESWYRKGVWRGTKFGLVHLTDYLRMLSASKGGGFYMDLDVITLKPLDEGLFWNFFSIEDVEGDSFCSGIFHLEQNHRLMGSLLKDLAAIQYDPEEYSAYGPLFVKKILTTYCRIRRPDFISSNRCKDITILPRHFFFPIPWQEWARYFKPDNRTMKRLKSLSYGVHVWNKMSRHQKVVWGSQQPYAILAEENCPLTVAANKAS